MSAGRPAPHPLLGVGLILVVGMIFATMDTTVRHLGAQLSVLLLLTVRYLVQAVVMGVWISASPRLSLRPTHPRFQALRGALLLTVSVFSFLSVRSDLPIENPNPVTMAITPIHTSEIRGFTENSTVNSSRANGRGLEPS